MGLLFRRKARPRWRSLAIRVAARRVTRHLIDARGTGCACAWHARLPDVVEQIAAALPGRA